MSKPLDGDIPVFTSGEVEFDDSEGLTIEAPDIPVFTSELQVPLGQQIADRVPGPLEELTAPVVDAAKTVSAGIRAGGELFQHRAQQLWEAKGAVGDAVGDFMLEAGMRERPGVGLHRAPFPEQLEADGRTPKKDILPPVDDEVRQLARTTGRVILDAPIYAAIPSTAVAAGARAGAATAGALTAGGRALGTGGRLVEGVANVAATAAVGAGENAAFKVVENWLTPGADLMQGVDDAALYGAAFAGGIGGLVEGAKVAPWVQHSAQNAKREVKKGLKAVQKKVVQQVKLKGSEAQALFDRYLDAPLSGEQTFFSRDPAAKQALMREKLGAPGAPEHPVIWAKTPDELKPSFIVVYKAGDVYKARAVEQYANQIPKAIEFDIDGPAAAARVGEFARKHNVAVSPATSSWKDYINMPDGWLERMTHREGQPFWSEEVLADLQKQKQRAINGRKDSSVDSPMAIERKRRAAAAAGKKPDLDAPPAGLEEPEVHAVVHDDGHVKMQPTAAPEPVAAPEAPPAKTPGERPAARGRAMTPSRADTMSMEVSDALKIGGGKLNPELRKALPIRGGSDNFTPAKPPDSTIPPDPPQPYDDPMYGPKLPPWWIHEALETDKQALGMLDRVRQKGFKEWFMQGILADQHRGPRELRMHIQRLQAAKGLQKDMPQYLEFIRKRLPSKNIMDTAGGDLVSVRMGRMSWEQFAAKHPQVSEEAMNTFRTMVKEFDADDALLAQLGMVSPDKVKMRQNHANHHGWMKALGFNKKGKFVGGNPYSERVNNALRNIRNQNNVLNQHEAAHELMNILTAVDETAVWENSRIQLGQKGNFAQWVRDLLGEIDNGPIRFAVTRAHQKSLVEQGKLWAEIVPYTKDAPDELHNLRIPPVPSKYGLAAGKWVGEHMRPLIEGTPKVEAASIPFLNAIGMYWKGNQTVFGGVSPWRNNVMRNLSGTILSGGIDFVERPIESGKAIKASVVGLWQYYRDPVSGGGKMGLLIKEARERGVSVRGMAATELSKDPVLVALQKHMAQMPHDASIWDQLEYTRGFFEKAKWPFRAMKRAYDFIDEAFKVTNYVGLRMKFLRQGMTPEQAADLAALRINQSFPNFEHVGRAVQTIRAQPFGGFAPYAASELEDWRVIGMLPSRLKDEPDLAFRLIAYGMLINTSLLTYREMGKLNGIPDEEVEVARELISRYSQQYRQLLVAKDERDENGNVEFLDLSQYLPQSLLAEGNPDDPLLGRITSNILMAPVRGGLYQMPARETLEGIGLISPMQEFTPKKLPGDTAWRQLRPLVFKSGPVPGAIVQGAQAVRKTGYFNPPEEGEDARTDLQKFGAENIGVLGPTETPYTARQAAEKFLLGTPTIGGIDIDDDGRNVAGKAKEFSRRMRDLIDSMKIISRQEGTGELSPETANLLRAEVEKQMNALATQQEQLEGKLDTARKAREGAK
jgi:hypothetical protein